MKTAVYRVFSATRADRLAFRLGRNRLRILAYHAVCENRLAGEPWIPAHFVTRSAFESQLAYLQQHCNVLSLHEAVARLKDNKLSERSVVITFDDGYSNNLRVAYPLLQRYGVPATIFLATQYVESGEFFLFDRIRLIRNDEGPVAGMGNVGQDFWLGYHSDPLDAVLERVRQKWSQVVPRLVPEQREALRPLRVNELQIFDPQLIEFGAHTHRHPILRNESVARREGEISTSINRVQEWTGRPVRFFSYPNGQLRDFGEQDKEVLRRKGIEAAVTMVSGMNRADCDLYGLRRYGLGLCHSENAFVAEVTGFTTLLKSLAGSNAST